MQPRRGVPKDILQSSNNNVNIKLSYNHNMIGIRLLDHNPSTAYGSRSVNTGRKHWQTKKPISTPEIICVYNKFVGEVDRKCKLLKYSVFSRHNL